MYNKLWFLLLAVLLFAQSCKKDSPEPDDTNNSVIWGNAKTIVVTGRVLDENGNVVSGATVKAGNATTTTDNLGVFYLTNAKVLENLGYVTVTKQGYFLGSRSFVPKQGSNVVNIRMLTKTIVGNVSASNGGSVNAQGVNIVFKANSFNRNNAPYNGQVNVALKYINPESQFFTDEMPSNLIAVQDGNSRGLTSYGMIAVELTDNSGDEIKIANGQTATISFPLSSTLQSTAPNEIDLWSFDETNGYWKHEGKATFSNGKYVAQVKHFSFWNCDVPWQMVKLEGQVKDAANTAIQGAKVILTGSINGTAYDYTNTTGNFGGFVPANEVLNINIEIPCGGSSLQSVYSAQIGPFATATVLPAITVSNSNATIVTGSLVDCNNAAIATGYVVANNQAYFLNNGQFSFLACGNTLSITPYTSPVWSSGQQQTFTLSDGNLNLGNLQVCGGTNTGTVTDIDGNVYQTVQIGNQTWMAENLKTTRYANGDVIPNVTDKAQWSNLSSGAWCHYDNNPQYESPYGKLYNWFSLADLRNVCPTGWHVPTDSEWSDLINYLDSDADGGNIIPNLAGGKMKSEGTLHWQFPNIDATNESGFSGYPGGECTHNGDFQLFGAFGVWWSHSETNVNYTVWTRSLNYTNGDAERYGNGKKYGHSVRCIKD